jgi:hypothetical protein
VTFAEVYPSYLADHATTACRRLHFLRSALALVSVGTAIVTFDAWWLLVGW